MCSFISVQCLHALCPLNEEIVNFYSKKSNDFICFQSCWRAYVIRRSITNKKVVEMRKRIIAADSSEPNKLKNRTSRSLELLFKDSRVSSMMEALQELGKICIINVTFLKIKLSLNFMLSIH